MSKVKIFFMIFPGEELDSGNGSRDLLNDKFD
jgi:hypothetical protein